MLRLARTAAQLQRQHEEVEHFALCGFGDEVDPLDEAAATERLGATRVLGGLLYRPCARVHPARLVRGLASAVERLGGSIVERTPASELRPASPGRAGGARPVVVTDRGVVTADVVVRATEAYSRDLPGTAARSCRCTP